MNRLRTIHYYSSILSQQMSRYVVFPPWLLEYRNRTEKTIIKISKKSSIRLLDCTDVLDGVLIFLRLKDIVAFHFHHKLTSRYFLALHSDHALLLKHLKQNNINVRFISLWQYLLSEVSDYISVILLQLRFNVLFNTVVLKVSSSIRKGQSNDTDKYADKDRNREH